MRYNLSYFLMTSKYNGLWFSIFSNDNINPIWGSYFEIIVMVYSFISSVIRHWVLTRFKKCLYIRYFSELINSTYNKFICIKISRKIVLKRNFIWTSFQFIVISLFAFRYFNLHGIKLVSISIASILLPFHTLVSC